MILRFLPLLLIAAQLLAADHPLGDKAQTIMNQPKYAHATWGILVKESQTDKILFEHNSDKFLLPASTTKLFSTAALLHAFGDSYRFKTPVIALGEIKEGTLVGNLVLIGSGDLTFGGRNGPNNTISFTKMDHIIANNVPGALLTPEDPLDALKALARQIYDSGIRTVEGDVVIDDRLFEQTERRGNVISPVMINENLIDITLTPTAIGAPAKMTFRPEVRGYTVKNEVQTSASPLNITITGSESEGNITIKGTLPLSEKEGIVRTYALQNPKAFAKAAFLQELTAAGITFKAAKKPIPLPSQKELLAMKPAATYISPPISEAVKLILKVSHNLGADLIPLLLATKEGKKTFDEGMQLIGDFVTKQVKIDENSFVFLDAAGGDENRLTPQAEVALLEYMRKKPLDEFQHYFDALPILGVDGSLADFGKNTVGVNKIRAKPGTGITYNTATGQFFLTTQTLAGYMEGTNGHLLEYMVGVNNAELPSIEDINAIFEDVSALSAELLDESNKR